MPISIEGECGGEDYDCQGLFPEMTDKDQNVIDITPINQEFFMSLDLTNNSQERRDFLYIIQIKNQNGETESIVPKQYIVDAGQSVNGVISVLFTENKKYTMEVFVWESLENPIPIYTVVSRTFDLSDSQKCLGDARCFYGIVTKVIDGDTIKVDGQSVRFALASAPELSDGNRGIESKNLISDVCPVGSSVLVDEDDMQTDGSYGRILGVIFCNGENLNERLAESQHGDISVRYCEKSEFGTSDWAKKNGC